MCKSSHGHSSDARPLLSVSVLDPCPSGLTEGHALPHLITPVEATLPVMLSRHCWEKCLKLWTPHHTIFFVIYKSKKNPKNSKTNIVFFHVFLQPFYGLMAVIKWFISNLMLWVLSNSFWYFATKKLVYLYVWIIKLNVTQSQKYLLVWLILPKLGVQMWLF